MNTFIVKINRFINLKNAQVQNLQTIFNHELKHIKYPK